MALEYPAPTSAAVSSAMRGNRKTDTRPELRLRSALHRHGLRFRKSQLIIEEGLRVRADVTFNRARIAIFVDGCFWHRCPVHGKAPTANATYWSQKLSGNVERDQIVTAALEAAGWLVLRVWEHEVGSSPQGVARRVGMALAGRQGGRALQPTA